MQRIPVIFAKTWKPISLIIRLFTWSRWSHCGIITEDGKSVIESVGGKGVIVTPLLDFKRRYSKWHIAYVPVQNRRISYQLARAEIGKEYDLKALFAIALRRDWECPDSWFCSELIAHACQGLYRRESVSRITPECIWRNSRD